MKPFTPFLRLVVALCVLVIAGASARALAQDQPSGVPDLLSKAFIEYEVNSKLREAEALCDRIVLVLQGVTPLSDPQVEQLMTAYELRGRIRFLLKNVIGAQEDFRAILMRSPAHEFMSLTRTKAPTVPRPTIALFETVRGESIGSVVFNITPADAEVQFRDAPLELDRWAGGRAVLTPVGTHTLTVKRRMYETAVLSVEVKPGPPVKVELPLKRVRSQIDFVTSVPGVEILINGVSHRSTSAGPLPSAYASKPDVVALGPTPGVLTVMDIPTDEIQVQLRKECYTTDAFPMKLDPPTSSYITRTLIKSAAPLVIAGTGATVWIDGEQQREGLPYAGELCPRTDQRERLVEVRNSRGRQVRREQPIAGRKIEFAAEPRPTIAILSKNNVPKAFTEDLGETIEKTLLQAGVKEVTFFSVRNDLAQNEMRAAGVSSGWLAIDGDGRYLHETARLTASTTRQTASVTLSDKLDVQGVAEITVPAFDREQRTLVLTFLAKGSAEPEAISINLEDPRSVQAAVAYFNDRFRQTRVASGLIVADVQGVPGAVVLHQAVDTTGGVRINEGDVITSVDGAKIPDASKFEDLISAKKAGETVTLQVLRRKGSEGAPTVRLTTFELQQVVAFDEQTLPVNRRLLEFRDAVDDARTQEKDIARLNLAIVLMRAGIWSVAKAELDKIGLADLKDRSEGISRGTVQYYLGVCLDGQAKTAEANKAYEAARDSPGAWLTADGLLVKPFAEQKLADKTRQIR